ncbi:MAG: arsenic resistance protein [Xanthomonadaceae bacterium]|nr:arsenic resistance protein [Silanimonas sp.]MBS3924293.1 arsenic resistance protein [Xanthomonadaceae bacterium]
MTRETLERRQVWVYLAAIAPGLVLGTFAPQIGPAFEMLLWPVLGALLYATFVQIPLLHLADACRDRRFITAVLIGNFLLIPPVVWGMVALLPPDPALRLGVLLALLVPCTDWFITLSKLGKGDVPRAIAVTPINLLLQLALLPLYLWMMAGADLSAALTPADVWPAVVLVLAPLGLAALSERWMEARPERATTRERLAWWPVPLLAVVVFLIAGAQAGTAVEALALLPIVVPVFIGFLIVAALMARALASAFRLEVAQGRTLAFSLGTRNSFVVLPFALTLPAGWEVVALVIVVQSLVELFGMVMYLWWLPRRLFAK